MTVAALVAVSAGMMTGCSLDVEPQNIITDKNFWNEKTDVEQVIAGCYSAMETYGMISRMLIWGEFRAENVFLYGTTIEKDLHLQYVLKEEIKEDNVYTIWTEFYNIINRCNTVIERAPEVKSADPSYLQSQLDAHIAEATAIRALCYFYLIRTFRDVPYSTKAYVSDEDQLVIPATNFNEILADLINSLESVRGTALLNYTNDDKGKYGNYTTGRITRAAIDAMLCEMYLWKGDYNTSIKYADEVINEMMRRADEKRKLTGRTDVDPTYFTTASGISYPLIPCRPKSDIDKNDGEVKYGNAFNKIFADGNSEESIFELNFVKDEEDWRRSNEPVARFYGCEGIVPYVGVSDYVGTDVPGNSLKVFASKYDGRAYENMIFASKTQAKQIQKYVTRSGVSHQYSQIANIFEGLVYGLPYTSKNNGDKVLNRSNYIIYRLTDVMLLKAEALIAQMSGTGEDETGVTSEADKKLRDEAYELIDIVNKRSIYVKNIANLPSGAALDKTKYTTKNLMLDLVYSERNRELMFEGKRYFDLVRRSMRDNNTDYLVSKVKEKNVSNSSAIVKNLKAMTSIFWPYNQEELKVNNLLHQNPSYNSGGSGE